MSVYNEILTWSQTRSLFIRDALRRIVTGSSIQQVDVDELVQLLKKENGDSRVTLAALPLDATHLPNTAPTTGNFPRIIGLKHPRNICALYDQGNLEFAREGMTVIYGNNGSGKSSYSRILKKLCWSRNPGIILKRNVFVPSTSSQQVEIVMDDNGTTVNFTWVEGANTHDLLSSVFVYDSDCAEIYLNKENPTQYKPIGIDVMEKLVSLLGRISQSLTNEVSIYTTQKPILNESLSQTESYRWYGNIESLNGQTIDSYIQFSDVQTARKQELWELINSQNPQANIQQLTLTKGRYTNYIRQILQVESLFSPESLTVILSLRRRFNQINQAYQVASNVLNNLNTLDGFGTDPWRALWESAKRFAQSVGMSDGENFPSSGSLEKCVLCQQDLDEAARQRLVGFNQFVMNDISSQLNAVKRELEEKLNTYTQLSYPPFENMNELEAVIPQFRTHYDAFIVSLRQSKDSISNYLQNDGDLQVNLEELSSSISGLIPTIDLQIEQNTKLATHRGLFIAEYNELASWEILFTNKATIVNYCREHRYKTWINRCQGQLSTTAVSKKIGELMEAQAVSHQHQEFINHLTSFNPILATKVLLSKTRTSQGSTFQKCSLTGLTDTIDSILSEGEQKIIALSNFLAESTIGGRLNTIVFDDPVTSLDMDYREKIANKIVHLSANRQIIVWTHDLSFLRLLIDTHKANTNTDCHVIGIDSYNGISGVVTDEIPYLAKNVQERINSIRRILTEHDGLAITDGSGRQQKVDSAQKRVRMLLERSVEEVLSNKAYERFNKNVHVKRGNLCSYIVTEKSDIDFLLSMYSKYSVPIHDGGTSTIPALPGRIEIGQDIQAYSTWRIDFGLKLKTFKDANNYN